tara:strand:+ start:776 stop:1849 length:1074 start_codon:yes stop_codon:yes gene_type:complete
MRIRQIFLIITLLFTTLTSQSLVDRFKVPIYYTSSFSIGYDNNLFRLSDLNLATDSSSNIVNSNTFDSGSIFPKIEISYSPYIFSSFNTQLEFSATRNHYFSSSDKSFSIFYSQLGFKLAPYQSIKITHRYIPKYYLRNYVDHDYDAFNEKACTFSIESFAVSYSHPLSKKNWVKFRLIRTNYFYNPYFTEFDTQIFQLEAKYYFRLLDSSNNIWYSFSDGKNISYESGYFSTNINRSYGEHNLGLSIKKKIRRINEIDNFGLSIMLENRFYQAKDEDHLSFDSWESALHNGRKHNEINFSFWIDKKLNNKFKNQIKFKYRNRSIQSNYYWISDFKDFNKFEIIYKISFSSDLDLLY